MTDDTYLERPVMIHYFVLLNGFHFSFPNGPNSIPEGRMFCMKLLCIVDYVFFSWLRCGIDKAKDTRKTVYMRCTDNSLMAFIKAVVYTKVG